MTALPRLSARAELAAVTCIAWLVFCAFAWGRGEMGISWDALNHQIYLGWTADAPRFHLDVLAATSQSYQYPYLYWPLYKMALGGFSGAQAALVIATLHLACVPALWLVARRCMPQPDWFGAAMRTLAIVLAFASGLIVSLFQSTSNDMLAAIPLLWALAIAFPRPDDAARGGASTAAVLVSGLLGGVSVAVKFSNGPLVLLLPVLWMMRAAPLRDRLRRAAIGCAAILAAFVVAYAPWGWQLWEVQGNPIYPFADGWFSRLRAAPLSTP